MNETPNEHRFSKELTTPVNNNIPVEVTVAKLNDSGGHITGRLFVIKDISERKKYETEILQTNASLRASLEEISRLQSDLQEQAVRDPLTGLFNRRYFDVTIDEMIHNLHDHENTFSIVMIDIDGFKQLNDASGHLTGDEAIRNLAKILLNHSRASDSPCRYGGDEFVVILPGRSSASALHRVEVWRENFESYGNRYAREYGVNVSFSAGIASYPNDGDNPMSVFKAADTALYNAKASGKNRVICAGDETIISKHSVLEIPVRN